jgi:outer membrane protein
MRREWLPQLLLSPPIFLSYLFFLLFAPDISAEEQSRSGTVTPPLEINGIKEELPQSLTSELPILTLQEGLKIVTQEARLIRIAALNEDIARSETRLARSRLLPSVNAYVRQTFLAYQPGARFGPQEVYTSERSFLSYGVNLYQTIYDFGGDISLYNASKKAVSITENDTRKIRNLISFEFTKAYLDLLEIEKLINVAEREVESLEAHLKDAIALFEEGMSTKNERLEIEVRLSDARQRLLSLKNQRSLYVSRINSLIMRPLDTDFRTREVEISVSVGLEAHELSSAYKVAEELRPEIKAIDNEIEVLRLREKAKASEYYPRLFLQTGYEYTENRYTLHEDNWSLVFGLTVNLFSGGSTSSEIARLRAQQSQLLEERKRLIDDIRLEVKRYFIELKNAADRLEVTQRAISQAEENLRINKIRFEEGAGKSTDVLDAIALLSLAETNYYRARYEYLRAKAGLLYAMGKDIATEFGAPF